MKEIKKEDEIVGIKINQNIFDNNLSSHPPLLCDPTHTES